MKNIISTLMVVCLLFAATSCGITQKFTVTGDPGTEIYDPLMEKLGVIDNSGKAKIVLKKKDYNKVYVAYLMAHKPGTDAYIPFALNYKNATLAYGKFLGYSLATSLAVTGAGAAIVSSSDIAGGILMGLGGGYGFYSLIAWPILEACSGPSDKFRYLKDQRTVQDIYFTKPIFTSEAKILTPVASVDANTNIHSENEGDNAGASRKRKTIGDRSRKSLKDYGQAVEDIYTGTGTLTDQDGNTIEEYSAITIEIIRVDNNNVTVNVFDDNGEQFFVTPNPYKVSKGRKGNFTLKHNKISGATLQIDKAGKAVYRHPKVNIDGDIYKLSINAEAE